MPVRAVDDKPSDTLVVVSGEGFWTGSSTLPHLHHASRLTYGRVLGTRPRIRGVICLGLSAWRVHPLPARRSSAWQMISSAEVLAERWPRSS